MMNEADLELAEVMRRASREISEVFGPLINELAKAVSALNDAMLPLVAAGMIGELEMDLKLISEVGLRTDLLALFDGG